MKIFRSNDYLSAMIYENPYYDKHNNRYHDDLNKNEKHNEYTIYLTLQNSRLKDLKQLHFRSKVGKCRQYTRLGVVEGLIENGPQQNQMIPSSLKFTRVPYLTVNDYLKPIHKIKNPTNFCKRVRGIQNLDFEAENEKLNKEQNSSVIISTTFNNKSKKDDEEDYNKFVF